VFDWQRSRNHLVRGCGKWFPNSRVWHFSPDLTPLLCCAAGRPALVLASATLAPCATSGDGNVAVPKDNSRRFNRGGAFVGDNIMLPLR
jgi:hypothetical protein